MSNENTQQNPQEEDKTNKQFDATLKRLVAVVGGKENLSPKKRIKKDTLANVVNGLLQEKREATEKEVKEKLTELLAKKVAFDKEMSVAKADLDKLEKTKKKEFIEASQKVFQMIDGIDDLEKDYYKALGETQS